MDNWQQYNQPYDYGRYNNITGNAVFVTSLEEAIMRTTARNSDMVYFHQDLPIFYRIKVDMEGKKYWQEMQYSPKTNNAVTNSDDRFKNIDERLCKLESMLLGGETNVKSDG